MKLKEFQAYLKKEGIDIAFLVHPDSHITYFTQMKPSFAVMAITPTSATLYLTKLDQPPKIPGIAIRPFPKHWEKKILPPAVKEVGLNKKAISLSIYEALKKSHPKITCRDIGKAIWDLRVLKTTEEIIYIRKACYITAQSFAALLQELPRKTLHTEQDVALYLERFIRGQGADLAFPTIVASAIHSAIPHHVTSPSPLQEGFLQLDFGAAYHHYCADMSRVIYLGEPSLKEKQDYQLLLHCQEKTIQQVKEKKSFMALDKYSRKLLGSSAKYFIHSLGHGVGIDIHEEPVYSTSSVVKGQIFTIEPGIYFPQKYGLRIEDTLFFDGTPRILTTAPKDLKIIPWLAK